MECLCPPMVCSVTVVRIGLSVYVIGALYFVVLSRSWRAATKVEGLAKPAQGAPEWLNRALYRGSAPFRLA